MEITNIEVHGFEPSFRGMRNSFSSWSKSTPESDMKLAKKLIKAGTAHSKFLRFITVWFDCDAPIFWWKQFDTYKYAEKNSTSTMHTILREPLSIKDFETDCISLDAIESVEMVIDSINSKMAELDYKSEERQQIFRDVIFMLPESYKQKRTVVTNYQELLQLYFQRKGHKLIEWSKFNSFVESLPMMKEFIEGAKESDGNVSDNHG